MSVSLDLGGRHCACVLGAAAVDASLEISATVRLLG